LRLLDVMSKNLKSLVRELTGCTAAVHDGLEGMCMRGFQNSRGCVGDGKTVEKREY
jgi:hypothetical protein